MIVERHFGSKLRVSLYGPYDLPPATVGFIDTKEGRGTVHITSEALYLRYEHDPPGLAWQVKMSDVVASVSTVRRRRKVKTSEAT